MQNSEFPLSVSFRSSRFPSRRSFRVVGPFSPQQPRIFQQPHFMASQAGQPQPHEDPLTRRGEGIYTDRSTAFDKDPGLAGDAPLDRALFQLCPPLVRSLALRGSLLPYWPPISGDLHATREAQGPTIALRIHHPAQAPPLIAARAGPSALSLICQARPQPQKRDPFAAHAGERGMISVLVLMPLLITLLAVVVAGSLVLKSHKARLKQCREITANSQHILAAGMARLTRLNPQARRLQNEQVRLQHLLTLPTLDPGTKAVVTAALARVRVNQRLLAAQQKSIIRTSQRGAEKILREAQAMGFRETSPKVPFSLYPWPPFSASPVYRVPVHFSRLQALKLDWRDSLAQILPSWLARSLPPVESIRGLCTTTLVYRRSQWQVRPFTQF